jgi:hypothetical protein
MAIPLFTEDMDIVSKLGDYPGSENGMSPQEFKQRFDIAGKLIKDFLNNTLIPMANLTVDPDAIVAMVLAKALDTGGGTLTGTLYMSGERIADVGDPVLDGDAVPNGYFQRKVEKLEYHYQTVTLKNSEWVNHQQTVSVPGISTGADVTVSPAPAKENFEEYSSCVVLCVAINDDAVVFECDYVPGTDLAVNIKYRNLEVASG